MRKFPYIILIIYTLTIVTSCKKEHKYKFCYTCTFSYTPTGGVRPPLDTCCNDNDRGDFRFKDANGNPLTVSCVRK